VTASVRLPLGTAIVDRDRLQVLNVAGAEGGWDVVTIGPKSDHVRVMVRGTGRPPPPPVLVPPEG